MTGSTPPLDELYESFRGQRVYVDELPGGNNGDQLIILGGRAFRDRFDFEMVQSPSDAQVIIIRGNGVLTEFYANTPHRARMQAYLDDFPDRPIVVEPSTLWFPKERIFDTATRNEPMFLYARDLKSFETEMSKPDSIAVRAEVGLGHDMALHLRGSQLLEQLADEHLRHGEVLVVERYDIESPKRALRSNPTRRVVARLVPDSLKDRLRPRLAQARSQRATGFCSEAQRVLASLGHDPLPEIECADVSNPRLFDFDEFVHRVARSPIVLTQRLHPGILAALLGRETWLDDRGYFKIREIYNWSLSNWPNVHLMSSLNEKG